MNHTTTLESRDIKDLIRLARALTHEQRFAEAEEAWKSALRLQPDALTCATGLARLLDKRQARREAEEVLRTFISAAPSPGNVMAVAQFWDQWQDCPSPGARTIKVALTGSGTLKPLSAHLRVALAQIDLHPFVYTSEFNHWAQDLLDADSPLYQVVPDIIIIAIASDALFPLANSRDPRSVDELRAEREEGMNQIRSILEAIQRISPKTTAILHNFALPDHSPHGLLDGTMDNGQFEAFYRINHDLALLAHTYTGKVVLFDQERLESRHGKERVRDDRMWYMASIPYSDTFMAAMAAHYVRIVRATRGLGRKCVVVDLDNTLWGGIIGEDGINRIKIGGTVAPGNAFADFQTELLKLKRRGVLLAVCSKNNPDDAWLAIDNHPDMILRRVDFAAARINWQDKAKNIEEIAKELNIGLDSLVFLDDNPVERALVQQQLPEVLTVDMPRDAAYYARTLLALDVFETLVITEEDARRSALYDEQRQREQFLQSTTDALGVNAYLFGLEMIIKIEESNSFTIPRIAQLINKTNQFNLTTRRYTEAELQALAQHSDEWKIYAVNVSDRFGDSGLTGVAIIHLGVSEWEIDSLLLSCRVMGRGVEQALMRFIVDRAQRANASTILGRYLKTPKNVPVADFYDRMGFTQSTESDTNWTFDIAINNDRLKYPEWLRIN